MCFYFSFFYQNKNKKLQIKNYTIDYQYFKSFLSNFKIQI